MPFWIDKTDAVFYQPLVEDRNTDVVIVGGGIAGLSVAYELVKRGKKVIVVEDGYIGSGETGRTSAHLVSALDDRFYELERVFGADGARLAAESHGAAIDRIEKIANDENIDCGFKRIDGYLFLHPSDKPENMDKEYDAAKKAGLDIEKLDTGSSSFPWYNGPCLRFPGQARFHPIKYLNGLCRAIREHGGEIFTETRATEVTDAGIKTDRGHEIKAAHIVVATNAPITSKYILPLKQTAYRTYMIGTLVKKGLIPDALFWDTGDFDANPDVPPYHYVRTEAYDEENDLLLVGGEDHPTGQAEAEDEKEEHQYAALEAWVRKHFPVEEIVYRWSGQVMEPVDHLGYIGRGPGNAAANMYVVSGDSGNGLTNGTIAGMLLPDLIEGLSNPWEKLYSPSRFKLNRSGTWIKDMIQAFRNATVGIPKDKDPANIDALATDQGTIVKIDGNELGVYRDSGNHLHFVNARCTHMGCTVKWNNDEKTWDCPCHGSRFTYTGDVVNGPAIESLDYHNENPPVSDR